MGLILKGGAKVGEVYVVYRWFCSCGTAHESKTPPDFPLRCNRCGGINGGMGRGGNWHDQGDAA